MFRFKRVLKRFLLSLTFPLDFPQLNDLFIKINIWWFRLSSKYLFPNIDIFLAHASSFVDLKYKGNIMKKSNIFFRVGYLSKVSLEATIFWYRSITMTTWFFYLSSIESNIYLLSRVIGVNPVLIIFLRIKYLYYRTYLDFSANGIAPDKSDKRNNERLFMPALRDHFAGN